ncbi:hypothetical protein ACFXHA_15550 [Nocardia sp. NPDC059240]|uniref:hypothetical protein n=1 Tax=Nocardia sp. NPDC059240 TaxID=3346786 RepID=UPI00369BDD9A
MTMPATTSWIDDHCRNSRIVPITRERAEGIVALHASCTPPCPRQLTARDYLATHPEVRPCISKSC